MKRRRSVLLGFLLLAIWGICAYWGRMENDLKHDGIRLSAWLQKLDETTQSGERIKAEAAILALGTNAIPFLLSSLQTPDNPLRERFFWLLSWQRFVRFKFDRAQDWQRRAYTGFRLLGPQADCAIPDLQRLLDSPDHAEIALDILCTRGSGAIPALAKGLTNANPQVRASAALDLGYRRSDQSLAPLLTALDDPEENVRARAAYALSRFPHDSALVVPALMRKLDETNLTVRAMAAQSLGEFGPAAQPAIPALLRMYGEGLQMQTRGPLRKISPAEAAKLPEAVIRTESFE